MIQSIERAVDIISAIKSASQDGLFTMEIARQVGLSKAVCYNILKTLKACGVVEQSGNGEAYTLNAKFFSAEVDKYSDDHLVGRLSPIIRQSAEILGESVSLVALRNGFEMEILIREVCEQEIMLSPNRNKPLYSTASGRCLLAQMHSDILDEVIRRDGLPDNWMWEGIDSRAALESELEKIRISRRCEIISSERHVAAFGYIPEFSGRFSPLAAGTSLPLFRYEKMEPGAYKELFDLCCTRIDAVLKSINYSI